VISVVAGKWALDVLRELADGELRHNELRRRLGTRPTALSMTLRRLAGAGLVERRVTSGTPPAVSYRVTPAARDLCGVLDLLAQWQAAHMPGNGAARPGW
jgi:DNA-binding HxlR family transcriptional regulator